MRAKYLATAMTALIAAAAPSISGEPRPPERTENHSARVSVEDLRSVLSGVTTRSRAPQRPRPSGMIVMPVAGVSGHELRDSFGDPRSGGRSHQGIDIFAPRWTPAVAVVDGRVASIQTGARSGKALRVRGSDGRSYFYAHLEDWAEGLREGLAVRAGDLLGYVGNSGNAIHTPTHLHFEVRDRNRVMNPYPVLAHSRTIYDEDVRVASASEPRSRSPRRSIWSLIFGR